MSKGEKLLEETKLFLKKFGIRPKKVLGQSFLVDAAILERQVGYAQVNKDDIVLEIGAGTGNLTKFLLDGAGKVIVLERDPSMVKVLQSRFSGADNLELISGDALEMEFPKFDKVVSNIPYSISSPLTFKLLEHDFTLAVLTYQKEFAERLIAKPGTKNYSRLSVSTYCRADAKILEYVSRHVFYPVPKVSSAIVKLVPKTNPLSVDENSFQNLLRGLFAHRRKSVSNAIFHSYQLITGRNPPKDAKKENIEKFIPAEFRYEKVYELTPMEFATICNIIKPLRET